MRRIKPGLIFGTLILAFFSACALLPDFIAPYGTREMFVPWQAPGALHLLGTNDLGYDILSELVFSARHSLVTGLVSALFATFAGTGIGFAAGSMRGWRGEIASGLIQVFLLIPMLPTVIVVTALAGANMVNIIVTMSVLGWCATARAVRVRVMRLCTEPFVESLTVLDISRSRIVFRHVLPNMWELIRARFVMSVASFIMLEATLSFLGIGNAVGMTWGRMMYTAYRSGAFMREAWIWLFAPGICIALCIVAMYLINSYFESRDGEVAAVMNRLE